MFWTIFKIALIYIAIIIILVFISMYLVHRWTSNRTIHRARRKSKAAQPVDLQGVELVFKDGKEAERIEAAARELKERMGRDDNISKLV